MPDGGWTGRAKDVYACEVTEMEGRAYCSDSVLVAEPQGNVSVNVVDIDNVRSDGDSTESFR